MSINPSDVPSLSPSESLGPSPPLSCSTGATVAPDTVVSVVGGSGSDIGDTINQAGLNETYVSGVTCFDDFVNGIGFNSNHSDSAGEFVQTVRDGNNVALEVTYQFTASVFIDAIAWWQEDSHESSNDAEDITIETSLDDVSYVQAVFFNPEQTTANQPYEAETHVFPNGTTEAKYVRVRCFRPGSSSKVCGWGEVLFRKTA